MSLINLDKIFNPSSVAVVTSRQTAEPLSRLVMENLRNGGFQGRLFPVDVPGEELPGGQVSGSLNRVGEPVDLVVIAAPLAHVPGFLVQCSEAGAGGAIVLDVGEGDLGPEETLRVEAGVREVLSRGCIRLIGPHSPGFMAADLGLNATLSPHRPLPGKLAFLSQSRAVHTAVLDMSIKERIGFKYFIGVGSRWDVDHADLISYLGNDADVTSIALHLEGLVKCRRFMRAARAVCRIKPIVVLKTGRSRSRQGRESRRPGAIADEDAVYDGAFKRAGMVRVDTIEELFDCAELMARQPRPTGKGLAVITNSAGAGMMAADVLSLHGMEPTPLGAETVERLKGVLPSSRSLGNPVHISSDATPERFCKAVEACVSAPEVDSLLLIMAPYPLSDLTGVARSLCELLRGMRRSVFAVWMGGVDGEQGRALFNEIGIPTYDTPERAVNAYLHMVSYTRNLELLQEIPPKLPHDLEFDQGRAWAVIDHGLMRDNLTLMEAESKEILAAYGIPVNPTLTAATAEDAVEIARRMGYPVVMKVHSRDLTRKTEARGVHLDLRDDQQVRQAFRDLLQDSRTLYPEALWEGVSVQPMVSRSDCELILGAGKDASFGPVILFGMGGILTELIADRAIALPPLNRLLARRLLEETRIFQFLEGYKGMPGANLVHLEEVLIRFSQLLIDFPELAEVEINPLAVVDGKVCALDARMVLQPSAVASPMHLVISPYPGHYESRVAARNGLEMLIRPIKPEDAPLLIELFNALSPTTIYYRFFGALRSLSHEMLARFTQIDYDRDIALVAVQEMEDQREQLLGVCRLMGDPDVTWAEFAIVVGDAWQGLGVGAELLERCLDIARERGIARVWGVVLAENTTMVGLGRKLGFTVSRAPESTDFILRINLKPEDSGDGSCTLQRN